MSNTGCHVHFPETSKHGRSTTAGPNKNQVSITGTPDGAESARQQIRALLPITISFDVPAQIPEHEVRMTPDIRLVGVVQRLGWCRHSHSLNFSQRNLGRVWRDSLFQAARRAPSTGPCERFAGSCRCCLQKMGSRTDVRFTPGCRQQSHIVEKAAFRLHEKWTGVPTLDCA